MISSFRNPLVKRIKRLRQKKYRQREGAFFVEGIRPVLTALEHAADLEVLVFAPELLTSPIGLDAVRRYEAVGGNVISLSGPVFAAVSERENPAGLGAIVRKTLRTCRQLQEILRPGAILVALVEISDPGNLGTILRTADAAGAQGVILVGDTVDPFHPTALKASMGTVFSMPLAAAQSISEVWQWAAELALYTVASSVRAEHHYRELGLYRYPLLLLMGNEGAGLDESILGQANCAVNIPMFGEASSLNLAVATGLLLYEAALNPNRFPE